MCVREQCGIVSLVCVQGDVKDLHKNVILTCVWLRVSMFTQHTCTLAPFSTIFGKVACPDPTHPSFMAVACVCMCLLPCKCMYTHACNGFTNGQSLQGPLFSAMLLFSHIVPGHRNRSSPLPFNRPKTKPCQASQQPQSVCHLSPDQWWCSWNKGPGQGRRSALFTVLMSGWHSQHEPSIFTHVYPQRVGESICHVFAQSTGALCACYQ